MNCRAYKPVNVQRGLSHNKYDGLSISSAKYRKHIDPNFCDAEGRTALHAIVDQIWDNDVAIDDAVKDGCDVNAVDNHGCRPIHYAAEKGHVGCVSALIKHSADMNPLSKAGHSPLMAAARLGFGEVIKVLLHAGAKLTLENEQRETALHYAAGSRRVECVELFLTAKANTNVQDITGSSALIIASKQDDPDVMTVLIKAGADVNLADRQGRTALHWATINKNVDCAAVLIKARAELDKTDELGDSAFVISIKSNCVRILEMLIDAGCDRNNIDGLMGTAVALASLKGHSEIVELLVRKGEDPDECGYFGMTPLMLAAFESHPTTVDTLLRVGADVNQTGRMGGFALCKSLMRLSSRNDVARHQIVARLIRGGADVNYRAKIGGYFTSCSNGRNSTLSFAITGGYVSLIRMLLIAGIDVYPEQIREWMELNNIRRFFDFNTLLDPIMSWKSKPRSLMHTCRAVIRKNIIVVRGKKSIEHSIERLTGVPSSVKRFLNFSEFDDIVIERAPSTDYSSHGLMEQYQVSPCGLRALEGSLLAQTIQDSVAPSTHA